MEKNTPTIYKPRNKTPLNIDSKAFFFGTKIFCFLKIENKKKPNATIINLNDKAAKGSL